jgi:hypothetical protein
MIAAKRAAMTCPICNRSAPSHPDGSVPHLRLNTLKTAANRRLTMRRTILSLTGAAVVGVLALSGVQSTAQAREYWHHEFRYDHRDVDRDHDRDHGRDYWRDHGRHDDHGGYHRDHDRR